MIISMKGNQNHCISNDTSSLSCMIQLNPPQDQGKIHGEYHHQPQQETGSINQPVLDQANASCNQHIGKEQAQGSPKWMSSKMRLMRKMLGTTDQIHLHKQRRSQSLQDQASSSNSPSDIFRVCSNCKTTKTPLWRSGPQGPKSLCNACGIRQMKARRAMRAAAAAAAAGLSSGFVPAATNCKTVQQEERIRSDVDRTIPFKKRFKIVASASAQKKLRFDEVTVSLSNKPPFHQTFPQEEKDAAILLMALSCGLIHG